METFAPQVLTARVLPRSKVVAILAVIGFAALTALAAQWEIHLGFTPVPITGQTFAVLLSGAALGLRLGAASQALYLLLGVVGLPVYSGGTGGFEVYSGATAGYLIGFVFAAAVVGRLAENKHDRAFATALVAFLIGTFIIYGFGVAGLVVNLGMGVNEAILKGVAPFVFGDLIKAAAAGALLPTAWRLIGEKR